MIIFPIPFKNKKVVDRAPSILSSQSMEEKDEITNLDRSSAVSLFAMNCIKPVNLELRIERL